MIYLFILLLLFIFLFGNVWFYYINYPMTRKYGILASSGDRGSID